MDFLAEYGQADRRYEKIVRFAGYLLLATLVLGGIYWLFFRNWQEEWRVSQFLTLLEQQQYEEAYGLWGCSLQDPCRFYPYDKFLEDWGPQSPMAPVRSYNVGRSYEQRSGVIVLVQVNGHSISNLWVEKDTKVISFSPY
jgi:hypothetical protein